MTQVTKNTSNENSETTQNIIIPEPIPPESPKADLYGVVEPTTGQGRPVWSEWGMTKCKERWGCELCALLQPQPDQLKRMRDLYVDGCDVWVLARVFQLPEVAIVGHINRKRWDRKRESNLGLRHMHHLTELLEARVRDFWDRGTDGTADAALALMTKVHGVQKVAVKSEETIIWEDVVRDHEK